MLRTRNTLPALGVATLMTLALPCAAHDGHGLPGAHWHASDAWGFVAVGLLIAAALWLGRK